MHVALDGGRGAWEKFAYYFFCQSRDAQQLVIFDCFIKVDFGGKNKHWCKYLINSVCELV